MNKATLHEQHLNDHRQSASIWVVVDLETNTKGRSLALTDAADNAGRLGTAAAAAAAAAELLLLLRSSLARTPSACLARHGLEWMLDYWLWTLVGLRAVPCQRSRAVVAASDRQLASIATRRLQCYFRQRKYNNYLDLVSVGD